MTPQAVIHPHPVAMEQLGKQPVPAVEQTQADTLLTFDRTTKLKLYANAGIAESWIVNLQTRCIEGYREPTAAEIFA